jgi:hypothetical protein
MADQNERSNEQIRQASLNEQAGLIMYIREILNEHNSNGAYRGGKPGNFQSRKDFPYANFATIRGASKVAESSGHLSITKFVTKPSKLMNLLKLINHFGRTSDFATVDLNDIVIPRINFYKVFNNDDKIFRIPFGQLTDKQREDYKKNHLNIDMSLNEGVYLTAFKADFKGGNPAEINSNIEAEATIFFTDAALMTDEILVDTGGINTQKGTTAKRFNWIDIIAPGGNPNSSASEYKIKVEIGYDYDEKACNAIYKELQQQTKDAIREGLKKMTTILYLIPVSHNIKFDRETIEFTVQYQAAISQDMKKLDIFLAAEAKSALRNVLMNQEDLAQRKEKKLKDIKESDMSQKDKDAATTRANTGTNSSVAGALNRNSEGSYNFQEEQLKNRLEVAKNDVYSSILRQIVGLEPRAMSRDKKTQTGVYNLVVPPATLGLNLEGKVPEQTENSTPSKPFYELEKTILGHWPISSLVTTGKEEGTIYNSTEASLAGQQNPDGLTAGQIASNSAFGTGVTQTQSAEASQEIAKRVPYNSISNTDKNIFRNIQGGLGGKDKYLIVYMFLGDILDVACTCIKTLGSPIRRPRIILGNIKINLPIGNPIRDPNTGECKLTDEYYVNLADIPISYNLFQSFYINNLIADRPTELKLDFFINKIINELLIPALGPTYFGDAAGFSNNQIKISSANLSIPFTVNGTDVFTGKPKADVFGGIIDLEEFKSKMDKLDISNDLEKGSGEYIIYFDSSPPTKLLEQASSLKFSERKAVNYENGIIHLVAPPFGRGGLIGLEFSKVDIEGAREAAVLNDGTGDSNLLKLKQVYDISATYMPGLPFYRPGDIVFVEPYFGGSKVSDLSRQLGVEGYFQVISMSLQYNFHHIITTLKGPAIGIVDNNGKLKNRKSAC